jgi:hypothetical protein
MYSRGAPSAGRHGYVRTSAPGPASHRGCYCALRAGVCAQKNDAYFYLIKGADSAGAQTQPSYRSMPQPHSRWRAILLKGPYWCEQPLEFMLGLPGLSVLCVPRLAAHAQPTARAQGPIHQAAAAELRRMALPCNSTGAPWHGALARSWGWAGCLFSGCTVQRCCRPPKLGCAGRGMAITLRKLCAGTGLAIHTG